MTGFWTWNGLASISDIRTARCQAGLVAYRRGAGKEPVLRLTAKGKRATDDIFCPERWWQRRWSGVWYLMVYDIPETQRSYRNVLRQFLRQLRIGRLQGSVWITPRDIRPEYNDLVKAAGIESYAYLFEARTVLGLPTELVVRSAWPTDLLKQCQQWYCENAQRNWDVLRLKQLPQKSLWFLPGRQTGHSGQSWHWILCCPRPCGRTDTVVQRLSPGIGACWGSWPISSNEC